MKDVDAVQNSRPVALSRKLAEAGILLAMSMVLSLIAPVRLPFGGSVTLGSMVPIVVLGYRLGPAWGSLCGVAYGLFGLMLHPSALNGLSVAVFLGSLLLDYLVCHAVLGLAGIFRRFRLGLAIGAFAATTLKYAVHILSGIILWHEFAGDMHPLWYSIGYNGTYMIPEIILTTVLCVGISLSKPLMRMIAPVGK